MSALLELLRAEPAAWWALALILGLIIGSFLNVVILRLPVMMQRDWQQQCRALLALPADDDTPPPDPLGLCRPPSRCPACGHRLRLWENIPLLSWLLLRRRCSACRTPISWRYPLVELLSGLLSLAVAIQFAPGWPALAALALTWTLIAASFIDLDHQLLPDDLTLPLLWAGLLLSLGGTFASDPQAAILGAAAGYLLLWGFYHLFRLATGKEGMGYGDFKLMAALGAWLGWQSLPLILLLSSVVGAMVGLAMLLAKRLGEDRAIPFGPYIAAAGWIALLWGEDITHAYLRASGLLH